MSTRMNEAERLRFGDSQTVDRAMTLEAAEARCQMWIDKLTSAGHDAEVDAGLLWMFEAGVERGIHPDQAVLDYLKFHRQAKAADWGPTSEFIREKQREFKRFVLDRRIRMNRMAAARQAAIRAVALKYATIPKGSARAHGSKTRSSSCAVAQASGDDPPGSDDQPPLDFTPPPEGGAGL